MSKLKSLSLYSQSNLVCNNNNLTMKKVSIFILVLLVSVLVLSACRSSGPKCPGMYGQADDTEEVQPQ